MCNSRKTVATRYSLKDNYFTPKANKLRDGQQYFKANRSRNGQHNGQRSLGKRQHLLKASQSARRWASHVQSRPDVTSPLNASANYARTTFFIYTRDLCWNSQPWCEDFGEAPCVTRSFIYAGNSWWQFSPPPQCLTSHQNRNHISPLISLAQPEHELINELCINVRSVVQIY